jgi:hypothetical protein
LPSQTDSTDVTNWTELGYRNDTTAGDKEYDYGYKYTPAVGTTPTKFYAVYSRSVTATFVSGVGGATSVPKTETKYYNSNSSSTPTSVSVTAPSATPIDGLTFGGYEGLYYEGDTVSVSLDSNATYYAYYSGNASATFVSGINGNSEEKLSCDASYSSSESTLDGECEIEVPSPEGIDGWDFEGYDDYYYVGDTITLDMGDDIEYVAYYSGSAEATFISGDGAISENTLSCSSTYWSDDDYGDGDCSITVPSPESISEWSFIGYDWGEYSVGSTVWVEIGDETSYWASYTGSASATFVSGFNGSSSVPKTCSESYGSNSTTTAPSSCSIDVPSATDIDGFIFDSYEGISGDTVDVDIGASETYYANYYGRADVKFVSGEAGSKEDSDWCTVDYNSGDSFEGGSCIVDVPSPEPIEGWGDGDFGIGDELVLDMGDDLTYYASYSGSASATFISGENGSSEYEGSCTESYSSDDSYLPSSCEISVPDAASITNWEGGFDLGSSVSVDIGDNETYYASYSGSSTITFVSGDAGGSSSDVTCSEVYSSDDPDLPSTCTIIVPGAESISGWTFDGYEGVLDEGDPIGSEIGESYTSRAEYTGTATAVFVSGEDGVSSNENGCTLTYISNETTPVPSSCAIAAPTSAAGISGWSFTEYDDVTSGGYVEVSMGGSDTFYANYSRTVEFISGEYESETDTATQYYCSDGTLSSVTIPYPASIDGWTAQDFGGYNIGNDEEISMDDSTIFANYISEYIVSFDPNGGTGYIPSQTCSRFYNSAHPDAYLGGCLIEIPENTFTRVGYVPNGWDGDFSEGEELDYDDMEISIGDTGFTVYAAWEKADTTPPSCSIEIHKKVIDEDDGYIYISASDNVSGDDELWVELDTHDMLGGNTSPYEDSDDLDLTCEVGTYYGYVEDAAGNSSTCELTIHDDSECYENSSSDEDLPQCSIDKHDDNSGEWYLDVDAWSPLYDTDQVYVNFGGSGWTVADDWNPADYAIPCMDGEYTAYVKDVDGRENSCELIIDSDIDDSYCDY